MRSKIILYTLLFIALAIKFKHAYDGTIVNSDYAFQIEAGKNLAEGIGLVNHWVDAENLSLTKSKLMTHWAVGFSLTIIPLYWITGSYITASFLIGCLAFVILLFSSYKLLQFLETKQQGLFFFLTFFILTNVPFGYGYGATTDVLSMSLFMLSIYLTIKWLYEQKLFYFRLIYISLIVSLCSFYRYAYLPFIVILPLFLFVQSLIRKNKIFFYKSIF